jgi:hypothetical protein
MRLAMHCCTILTVQYPCSSGILAPNGPFDSDRARVPASLMFWESTCSQAQPNLPQADILECSSALLSFAMQARLAKLSKQAPASPAGGGAAAAASAEADDTEGFEHKMRTQALAKRAALGNRESTAAAPASRCCCTDQSQAHGVVGGHLDQHVMAGAAMQHPNPCSLRSCCTPSQTSAGCTRSADSSVELLHHGPAAEMLYQLHCRLMPLAEVQKRDAEYISFNLLQERRRPAEGQRRRQR